ncbi:ATP-dependent DNA helicase RecQ-like [Oculina patagonica]
MWTLERATVVIVTPLVSIMKDQVEELKHLGLKAFAVGIGEDDGEKKLLSGGFDVDLLYGSPETWCSKEWSRHLQEGQLGKQTVCFVVDEAHSVSAWGQVSIQKGKKKDPFRGAFSKVKDLRFFITGTPMLALTASVRLKDRASLWKACGMVRPLVVDVSPNKDNIFLGFETIEEEKEALNRLKWIATMVAEEGERMPQTIIFCKTFNDIAKVISFLLMNLRGKAFVEKEGQKVPLLGVYHGKTWDTQKSRTEKDFKEDGTQRVVVATCALGMGVNFPNVQYVVHYGPPQTVTEIIQQAGRAGRSGQQSYSFVYSTKRQLSDCDKDVKDLVKSESCMREKLYGHFDETVSSKEPGHLCCSVCQRKCQCSLDGSCNGDELVDSVTQEDVSVSDPTDQQRNLNDQDKSDLRLALFELKERYSSGLVSLFHEETCHGFSEKLINDIVDHAKNIFSGKYLTDNLAMYSSIHAIDVLEILQELFEDISQFEQEMDELHLLKNQFSEMENYLLASSMSSDSNFDTTAEFVVPEYELEF